MFVFVVVSLCDIEQRRPSSPPSDADLLFMELQNPEHNGNHRTGATASSHSDALAVPSNNNKASPLKDLNPNRVLSTIRYPSTANAGTTSNMLLYDNEPELDQIREGKEKDKEKAKEKEVEPMVLAQDPWDNQEIPKARSKKAIKDETMIVSVAFLAIHLPVFSEHIAFSFELLSL
jgi:hypothetical protein